MLEAFVKLKLWWWILDVRKIVNLKLWWWFLDVRSICVGKILVVVPRY